jgi:ubiquinol-cytochrome c reductase iron-sulfur subunit
VSHAEDHEGTRRDFLYYATAGAGAVVAGAAVWPLVNQMNPSADVQALSSIRVDISGVEPGTQISVKYLGKPVFIRRRTEDEILAARDVDLSDLIDSIARNPNLAGDVPATDENRALDETGE